MGRIFFIVDAFTVGKRPFSGNPASVCLVEGPPDEKWMQDAAAEFNLSETAFLEKKGDAFALRWFTPIREVELCGHATLASAHVLFTEGFAKRDNVVRFETLSGTLTAAVRDGAIELDFPAEPVKEADPPAGLKEALGADFVYAGRNRFDWLVEVGSEEVLRKMNPDLRRLEGIASRGFIVTAPSDSASYDFVSRFFAPSAGIDEDPVTGSAHSALGPYWRGKLGKSELKGFQASRRGGVVGVKARGERVLLSGEAVTVARGELV